MKTKAGKAAFDRAQDRMIIEVANRVTLGPALMDKIEVTLPRLACLEGGKTWAELAPRMPG